MNAKEQIDKLISVASDVRQIIAVHDEKLNQSEKKQEDLVHLIEARRNEMAEDIKDLHSRISTVQRELSTEITATESRIVSGINELKAELKTDQEYHNTKQKTLEDRIVDLEKWRYILLGAGIAGGWLLTKFGDMIEIVVK